MSGTAPRRGPGAAERPPLSAEALRRELVAPGGPYAALDVVDSVSSTNTALAAAARCGAADRTVLVAEYQSGGRGRLARHWTAPARSGLTFSVLLRPSPTEVPAHRWAWLPLLAGVALCRTVTALGRIPALLKWPNDLLLADGRKAAGILAEMITGSDSAGVVLGIGLNVTLRPGELPVPTATSLAIGGAACTDRTRLLVGLLRALHGELLAWSTGGGDPDAAGLRQSYRQRCATLGQQVRVELPHGAIRTGRAVDVDGDGRLVVVSARGERQALSAGDVTHVRTRGRAVG